MTTHEHRWHSLNEQQRIAAVVKLTKRLGTTAPMNQSIDAADACLDATCATLRLRLVNGEIQQYPAFASDIL